ncbi:glycosyltransferase family 2 protein [Alloiococcus sp. CFN-8]|uniref:glycosyltransferase family 2 protein n=1 Tax=Alloiococcus sp. CFN-8 TaxID=3416081 RepID=UPI003CF44ACB
MDLSIIIVSYNTSEMTAKAVSSVIDTVKSYSYEIIVVDNDSKDNSPKILKELFEDKIILIENKENLGFSRANNMGIRMARGEYILLLNSDTIAHDKAIDAALAFAKQVDGIGAVGAKILLKDGTLDKACKRGFPTPWNSLSYSLKLDKLFKRSKFFGGYHLTHISEEEISDVDCIMGAFMLLPSSVIEKVGLLDEDFFMYGEDIDWCYRIIKAGYKIIYYPKSVITHYKKASFNKRRKQTIKEFYSSMKIFYNKHYDNKYPSVVKGMVFMGINLRFIIAVLINSLRK